MLMMMRIRTMTLFALVVFHNFVSTESLNILEESMELSSVRYTSRMPLPLAAGVDGLVTDALSFVCLVFVHRSV